MKSPFPGMDPYLERHWRDVPATLIVYMRDALQPMLAPSLRARVEERLVVETPFDGDRGIYPDVLRDGDTDVLLALQSLVDRAYASGAYEASITGNLASHH